MAEIGLQLLPHLENITNGRYMETRRLVSILIFSSSSDVILFRRIIPKFIRIERSATEA